MFPSFRGGLGGNGGQGEGGPGQVDVPSVLMTTVITMTLVMDGDDGLLNELGPKDPFQGQNCCKEPC